MSSLDKSLDQIIAGNRKSTGKVTKAKKATSAKGKGVGRASDKVVKKTQAKAPLKSLTVARLANKTIDLSYATKVLCYNLPRDLKLDNIKEFFQTQIGGVTNVALNYNERAQFQGTATINFKNGSFAAKAVEKYNGAPIDNGATKLKLEIVVDTTKQPLAARIAPNKEAAKAKASPKVQAKKQVKAKKAQPAKTPKKAAKKNTRPPKKTAEELDQEMTDYFGN